MLVREGLSKIWAVVQIVGPYKYEPSVGIKDEQLIRFHKSNGLVTHTHGPFRSCGVLSNRSPFERVFFQCMND